MSEPIAGSHGALERHSGGAEPDLSVLIPAEASSKRPLYQFELLSIHLGYRSSFTMGY